MKFKQNRMDTQEKKLMKRTSVGSLVAATLMGVALSSTTTTVNADELETTAVTTSIEVDQVDYTSWTANTEEEITGEILEQSEQKNQDPLKDYTIKWGDTLSTIAEATGLTVEELAETNKIENVDLIFAGDNLKFVNKYEKATAKPTTGKLKKSAEQPSNAESETSREVEKTPAH